GGFPRPCGLHHGTSLVLAAHSGQGCKGAGISRVRQGPSKHPQARSEPNATMNLEVARSGRRADERAREEPSSVKLHGICIGTSGWTYADWRGPFYPQAVPKKEWLRWYAGQFTTTEVNGSFYRTPSPDAVRVWRHCTPAGFCF